MPRENGAQQNQRTQPDRGARPDKKWDVGILAVAAFCVLFTCGASSSAGLRAGRPGTVQAGRATYYAPRLAGRKTANGEIYDPRALTAAHPVLPFGTRVRVTRIEREARSVVVRINDRCAGRKKIIDLSEAAARRLGMISSGIVRARLEVLSAETEQN